MQLASPYPSVGGTCAPLCAASISSSRGAQENIPKKETRHVKMLELFTKSANGSSPTPTTTTHCVFTLLYCSHALPPLGLLGHGADACRSHRPPHLFQSSQRNWPMPRDMGMPLKHRAKRPAQAEGCCCLWARRVSFVVGIGQSSRLWGLHHFFQGGRWGEETSSEERGDGGGAHKGGEGILSCSHHPLLDFQKAHSNPTLATMHVYKWTELLLIIIISLPSEVCW